MTKNDGKRKFVFSVRIPDAVAARLKAYAGDNFSRHIGELFELLDAMGLFESSVEAQKRVDAARREEREKAFARVREWTAVANERRRAAELAEADRVAAEDQRIVSAENAQRRAARIAAGLPVMSDAEVAALATGWHDGPAEVQHASGHYDDGAPQSPGNVVVGDAQNPDTPDAVEPGEASDPVVDPVGEPEF